MTSISDLFSDDERRLLELALHLLGTVREGVPADIRPTEAQLADLVERITLQPGGTSVHNHVSGTVNGSVVQISDRDGTTSVTVTKGPDARGLRIEQTAVADGKDTVQVQAGGSVNIVYRKK